MGKLKAVTELFEGRHFDREVIILCVRWYLRFKLSLRDGSGANRRHEQKRSLLRR
jgi:transposase-like protein